MRSYIREPLKRLEEKDFEEYLKQLLIGKRNGIFQRDIWPILSRSEPDSQHNKIAFARFVTRELFTRKYLAGRLPNKDNRPILSAREANSRHNKVAFARFVTRELFTRKYLARRFPNSQLS